MERNGTHATGRTVSAKHGAVNGPRVAIRMASISHIHSQMMTARRTAQSEELTDAEGHVSLQRLRSLMKPRVFLADDDTSIRQMLRFVLVRTCSCEVVGEAMHGEEAICGCESLRPHILITDLRMPGVGGVGLLREIRRRHLGAAVVFYTAALDGSCVQEAIEAKPEGFVLKSDDLASLRLAIKSVSAGASFWAPQAEELRKKQEDTTQAVTALTPSERQVLQLLGEGKSTKEIAVELSKSVHTVSHQRQSIMDKLNLHSATALVGLARKAGISE